MPLPTARVVRRVVRAAAAPGAGAGPPQPARKPAPSSGVDSVPKTKAVTPAAPQKPAAAAVKPAAAAATGARAAPPSPPAAAAAAAAAAPAKPTATPAAPAAKPAAPTTKSAAPAAKPAAAAPAAAPATPKPKPPPVPPHITSAAAAKAGGGPPAKPTPAPKPGSLAAPVPPTAPPPPGPGRPLNLVFIAAECAPWSKTGGLGDVVGGLPLELAKRSHRVVVFSPRYDQLADAWDTAVTVDVGGETVRFFHTIVRGPGEGEVVDFVFIDHPAFLAKVWGKTGSKLYGRAAGKDWDDNSSRFALLARAALAGIEALPFCFGEQTDAIIANDWHSALVPVIVREELRPAGRFANTKVALCCHNVAFQGRHWPETWGVLGLPASARGLFDFEDGVDKTFVESEGGAEPTPAAGRKFKKLNWLKAGALAADKVLTVSPNYAREIASGVSKGVELDGVWRAVGVEGIVNGMSADGWTPASDAHLAAFGAVNYDADTFVAGKAAAKAALQAEVGLPVDPAAPLFGFVGRLEEQKGVDVLLAALPEILGGGGAGPRPQVVVLGTGKADLEAAVEALADRFPGAAAGVAAFNTPLAHLIFAGCDGLIVPSRFEPCGLIQLQAMAYGALPVAASTGGLVDTIKDEGTGFLFPAIDPDALKPEDAANLAGAVRKAAALYGTPAFTAMQAAAIRQDLSWAQPALKWEAVLEQLVGGGDGAAAGKKERVVTPAAAV